MSIFKFSFQISLQVNDRCFLCGISYSNGLKVSQRSGKESSIVTKDASSLGL